MLQELLGLRDTDVLPIKQEVEAQLAQKSESYQQNLAQYKQVFTEAIQREFTLNQQALQDLENLQRSLGLKDEDITRVEQPLLQQAEIIYQEKVEYENKTYDVILQGFQANKKIAVLKAVRDLTGLALKEAKDLVESTPKLVKKGIDLKAAEEAQKLIEVAGGKVVVRYESSSVIWEEDETEDKIYDVILQGFQADKKIAVLKAVRDLTGLALKEAKDLVESTPKPVKKAINRKAAEEAKKLIEVKGGKVLVIINVNYQHSDLR
ncbi:ribosomal protein L7/L12 [Nostoc sp.]|uniref:ribosomal protein L7/L12 n=1 Tax=Nostoc sp. TaxID=1180 RepID=UPI002FFB4E2B